MFDYTVITHLYCPLIFIKPKKKGRDLTQAYDKRHYTLRILPKAKMQHKHYTKNFDYATVEERLMTVSWSNDSHATDVVKLVYAIPIFPLTTNVVYLNEQTFRKL